MTTVIDHSFAFTYAFRIVDIQGVWWLKVFEGFKWISYFG